MDGATTVRLESTVLRLAADITKAAYRDAMRRHGLLPSTISLIGMYAEENLAALDEESSDVPAGARVHVFNGCPECGGPVDQ
ncbi:hypothetical protein [Actinomadura harenae]|uniref:Uncharacterized protein n=1 Tax=Actinomadura harenae TaxID=2483351 RepID=A0A3M2LXC1_9ACTN|nr:hypothetical protein [Actinomadura harenae]RMI41786.1 hypothetical protein EBO15_21825 [Actinomadura harenae]